MTIHRFFVYFLCLSLCLWYCLHFRFNGSMVSKQLPMRSVVRNTFNSLLRLMRMDRTNKKKKSNRQHIIIKSGLKFHLGERMTPYSIIGLLVLLSRAKKKHDRSWGSPDIFEQHVFSFRKQSIVLKPLYVI